MRYIIIPLPPFGAKGPSKLLGQAVSNLVKNAKDGRAAGISAVSQQIDLLYCLSRGEVLSLWRVYQCTQLALRRRWQTIAKLAVLQLISLLWLWFICELLLKTNCLFNGAERWNQFQYASLKRPSYVKALPEGAGDTRISFWLSWFHLQFAIPTGTGL